MFFLQSVASLCVCVFSVLLSLSLTHSQQIASHGLIDLEVKAEGDIWIDDHHTTEDIALALGQCLSQALGTRAGIHRFGDFSAPLDEALINVVLVCYCSGWNANTHLLSLSLFIGQTQETTTDDENAALLTNELTFMS